MKVQIVTGDAEEIEGFEIFSIDKLEDLSKNILNNECETIIANNIVNSLSEPEVVPFFNLLVSKLRLGGELLVSGMSLRLFCKSVVNNQITAENANEIIRRSKSLVDVDPIKTLLLSNNLEIEHSKIFGITYEIKARRK